MSTQQDRTKMSATATKLLLGLAVPASALGVLLGMCMAPAAAQTLEEIIVTATKRESRLQDIPVAVTAIDADTIQSTGATRLEDLTFLVPSLVADNFLSVLNSFSIRGIGGTSDNVGIEQPVSVYVDGVYVGRGVAFNTPFLDVERVEVLRGPQGTLFGRNTIAGVIQVITERPDEQSFHAGGEVSIGNFDLRQFRGNLTGPLTDRVSGKVSLVWRERDGYAHNIFLNEDVNDVDDTAALAQLQFKPTDSLTALFSLDYAKSNDRDGYQDILQGDNFNGDAFDYRVNSEGRNFSEREIQGGSATIEYTFGNGIDFTSISAYREYEADNDRDQDHSSQAIVNTGRFEDQQQFSQEFRLSSRAGETFEWLVGLFYFDQDVEALTRVDFGADFVIPSTQARIPAEVSQEAFSAFVSGTFHVSDKFRVSGGLNWTTENKDLVFEQSTNFPLFPNIPQFTDSLTDDAVSPTASLEYNWADDVLTYLKWSRGYKSGGFNATLVTSATALIDVQFDPEFADVAELGLKTSWKEGRIIANVTGFYTDYTDLQVQSFNGTDFTITNAAEASIEGVELDLSARPLDGLLVGVGLGWMDGKFDSFPGAAIDPVTGLPVDFAGNQLPAAPDFSGYATVEYLRPVGERVSLRLRGEYEYRDGRFTDNQNSETFKQQSYSVVNALIGLESATGRWRISAWGKNLTSEEYLITGFPLRFPGAVSDFIALNVPRTWGVEVGFRY